MLAIPYHPFLFHVTLHHPFPPYISRELCAMYTWNYTNYKDNVLQFKAYITEN